jgi:hypothetical protein
MEANLSFVIARSVARFRSEQYGIMASWASRMGTKTTVANATAVGMKAVDIGVLACSRGRRESNLGFNRLLRALTAKLH